MPTIHTTSHSHPFPKTKYRNDTIDAPHNRDSLAFPTLKESPPNRTQNIYTPRRETNWQAPNTATYPGRKCTVQNCINRVPVGVKKPYATHTEYNALSRSFVSIETDRGFDAHHPRASTLHRAVVARFR